MAIHRDALADMLADGILDAKTLARDLLGYLSDDDCEDFARMNDIDLGLDDDANGDDNDDDDDDI
jgi:hypothetical protein